MLSGQSSLTSRPRYPYHATETIYHITATSDHNLNRLPIHKPMQEDHVNGEVPVKKNLAFRKEKPKEPAAEQKEVHT